MSHEVDEANRRPLKSREWSFAQRLTKKLADVGCTPNGISVAGMVFALLAGIAFVMTSSTSGEGQRACWWLGALGVQMRLLANLLDGMVAVHANKASSLGEVFNEVPDRFSDLFILVGLGYAAHGHPTLGALAAAGAILTAYVRAFGASLGLGQDFCGPMAKPQRMFFVSLGAIWVGSAPHAWSSLGGYGIPVWVLSLVFVGSLVTVVRRLAHLTRQLKEQR